MARKPLVGTVAENVLEYGTGAINVDACRIGTTVETWPASRNYSSSAMSRPGSTMAHDAHTESTGSVPPGRWPANVLHDGSEDVLAGFPQSNGGAFPKRINGASPIAFRGDEERTERIELNDTGSAARFFYTAKATRADRDDGLDAMTGQRTKRTLRKGRGNTLARCPVHNGSLPSGSSVYSCGCELAFDSEQLGRRTDARNMHPTVKPTALMRYLIRMITPPGGIVFDPFMGTASTGKAALIEGFNFLGVEQDTEEGYFEIAARRMRAVVKMIRLYGHLPAEKRPNVAPKPQAAPGQMSLFEEL